MTQYNSANVELCNSQLKLKSVIKNGDEVTSNLSLNIIGDSYDEINFPDKSPLLTDREVSRLLNAVTNNSSANARL